MYFSTSSSQKEVQAYFQTNGFVVIREVISSDKIHCLNEAYQQEIVPSKRKLYRQNSNLYEKNAINAYGHVEQSFFDVLGYQHFPAFKENALSMLFDQTLMNTLTLVNGFDGHDLMQTALFDANTQTAAHQDSWYADSVPNGHMLGAWIALEDIPEAAGRFYVLPTSHRLKFHDQTISHSDWMARIAAHVKAHAGDMVAPVLKAGDVLFFNASVVHGSLPTQDDQYSRKSIVGHYLPKGLTYGNFFTTKEWVELQRHEQYLYYVKKPEYSLLGASLTHARTYFHDKPRVMKLMRKLQNKVKVNF